MCKVIYIGLWKMHGSKSIWLPCGRYKKMSCVNFWPAQMHREWGGMRRIEWVVKYIWILRFIVNFWTLQFKISHEIIQEFATFWSIFTWEMIKYCFAMDSSSCIFGLARYRIITKEASINIFTFIRWNIYNQTNADIFFMFIFGFVIWI